MELAGVIRSLRANAREDAATIEVLKHEVQKLRYQAQVEDQHHDRMVGELEKVYKERDEARGHCESIVDKAKELIARWDQPSWKDTAPTAGFINALRDAVTAYEESPK